MIRDLVDIPAKPLSQEDYRKWIEGEQNKIIASVETMDRHTCINHDYKLEQALTPGIYIRELTMPAGQLIFSKIHLTEHPFMITKGKVSVYDGDQIVTHEAPFKGITPMGTKRLLYTHEETTWITFHPTDSDDLEHHDKNGVIACDTFKEYDEIKGALCRL